MTYVITRSCCNDASCIDVCPVDCIHPHPENEGFDRAEMLHIDPAACVDCGACYDVCPAGAIVADHELTGSDRVFLDMARDHFRDTAARPVRRPFTAGTALPRATGSLRVAIVGTGPAACYAARALLATEGLDVRISMFDRLPVFGGLVRHGVAPDHLDTKRVSEAFARTLPGDRVELFLNVEIGVDLTHEDLMRAHHGVIYATGAESGRTLGIAGEDLPGSCTAAEFVGWYNGHPDHAKHHIDLSDPRAVIVGNGNVSLDIARILLSPPERLEASDIAEPARRALLASRIEEVVIVGRRRPADTAATTPELLALADLPDVDIVVRAENLPATSRKTRLLSAWAGQGASGAKRRVTFLYHRTPIAMEGSERVEAIGLRGDDADERVECGLVIAAIGNMATPIAGLPFDAGCGRMIHDRGKVIDGVYVAGWMKRGASGVIGTNRRCSAETVASLLADHTAGRLTQPVHDAAGFRALVRQRQPDVVDRTGWEAIDRFERAKAQGTRRGRIKLVDRQAMVNIAQKIQTVV